MDTRKRGRSEATFNANGGLKKSKPDVPHLRPLWGFVNAYALNEACNEKPK